MTRSHNRAIPESATPDVLHIAQQKRSQYTRLLLWSLAGLFFVFSTLQMGIVPSRLLSAYERFQFISGSLFPPILREPARVSVAAMESLQVAIIGTVLGIAFSVVLAIFAAKNVSPLGRLSWTIKGFAALVRAVPALIWALLFIVAVGLGPIAGILALAVNSIGMLVKIYSESIEEIPMGPIEALRSAGATRTQIAFQGILPSVMSIFIAWSVFRFDINIRYSSVLGVVGAGGIGWELIRATSRGQYNRALGVTIVIFVMVMMAELISEWLRNYVSRGADRPTGPVKRTDPAVASGAA